MVNLDLADESCRAELVTTWLESAYSRPSLEN